MEDNNIKPADISPITLAFLGDAVYTLIVRKHLALGLKQRADALHNLTVKKVNAVSQRSALEAIYDSLTDEEKEVFKKGKNSTPSHFPKHTKREDYMYATGLEALFGYLYLNGRNDRIEELYRIICEKEKASDNI